jgi:dTDP-4-amino-4,6-dideoxygalactose transaminase
MTTATSIREVPFFNYRGAFSSLGEPLYDVIRDVVGRGAFILQKDLVEFEQAISEFLGVKHVFGVGNATDGLIICFRAAGLKPGDEVIFPAHTMVASPAAVHFAGGVPVPVDIGPDHMIDPARVEAAVTGRTRFIMPVQLNGRTCDMDAIGDIARRHGLQIVEDAAQALGSRFRNKPAGTFGIASSFSLYPAKVLGCLGDGGLVVTDDDAVADKIHQLRDHGRNRVGEVAGWGMNSRLDNLQAAVLHLQFRDYDAIVRHRRALAAEYHLQLRDITELVLPPAPDSDARHFDVYQNYEIETERRDALKVFLSEQGIGTLIQWGGKAVHQFPALGFHVSLPATERFFERCLMLPMNTMVTVEDVAYVAGAIRRFFNA